MAPLWGRRSSRSTSSSQLGGDQTQTLPADFGESTTSLPIQATASSSSATHRAASLSPVATLRVPRGSIALAQLRGRVRSSTLGGASSSPAPRPPPMGNGTPSRARADSGAREDQQQLERRTREALQTSSAPAAIRSATPPPYSHHSLDRSPLPNPMVLDDRPRVPPPIYLRSSSMQPQSKLGTLTIHVPGWGVALVRPPRPFDLHPLEGGTSAREPPAEDTVLLGTLEVLMRERRRVQAISVGVQSVTKLNMGATRGWEEDGVFERGVEVLGGGPDGEGIWLEKGSQVFHFSLLLPATLATCDQHAFGRIAYILTARVEGVPQGRLGSIFKSKGVPIQGSIPFLADFQAVIARSDKIAQEQAMAMSRDRSREGSPSLSPMMSGMNNLGLDVPPSPLATPLDEGVITFGDAPPPVHGLYHRRLSSSDIPTLAGTGSPSRSSPLRRDTDNVSIASRASSIEGGKTERQGWLVGDICSIRRLQIHANPSNSSGVYQLDIRKEGYVEGLGPWRFSATSEAFTVASVLLLNLNIPAPAATCSVFFVRVLLSQTYTILSPRTPNDPPFRPEAPKNHVIYQIGRPHRHGETVLGHNVEALFRGTDAGGKASSNGWRTRAVARLPNHEKLRPTTNPGTITPIRVSHELLVRIFYSVEGETVGGREILGPGEVRMCQVRLPITVPSCMCGTATLNLPTYDESAADCQNVIDENASSELSEPFKHCICGTSFSELSATAVNRNRPEEPVEPDPTALERNKQLDAVNRVASGGGSVSGSGSGSGSGRGSRSGNWSAGGSGAAAA